MAEHHLRGDADILRAKKLCRQLRWSPYFQDALASPGGGTHGGVCAVVQPGFCIQKCLVQTSKVVQAGFGDCWFFLEMRFRFCAIAVGVIYLVDTIGVSGANTYRLRAVA
eukprot:9349788-Pyramimonas_sp.AAC.1